MANNELTALSAKIHELRELKRMQEELAAQIETLTDSVKSYMTEQNTDEIAGTDWKATWKACSSSRFDSKAFKAAHSDLYAAFTVTTTTRRFSVV